MRAAVIDIGSNSIKLLVAEKGPAGELVEVVSRTLEVRISAGIGSPTPSLSTDGIENGIAAVAELVVEIGRMGADKVSAVATSAVRDASNGLDFRERVKTASGIEVRILTGTEEANLIGKGLATDPALQGLRDFSVFDLGGGSLECLSFHNRTVGTAISLPLGCVRLTEKLVPDATLPFDQKAALRVSIHVKEALLNSGFPLPLSPGAEVVGTGGTLTTVRAMDAANRSVPLEQTDPVLSVLRLRQVLLAVGSLGLPERKTVPGLSPSRADVFPVALATLLALAELGGIQAFKHSLRNLRWGIAAEMLGTG